MAFPSELYQNVREKTETPYQRDREHPPRQRKLDPLHDNGEQVESQRNEKCCPGGGDNGDIALAAATQSESP